MNFYRRCGLLVYVMKRPTGDQRRRLVTATLNPVIEADVADLLRRELIRLAVEQEQLADAEAARVPYWAPSPPSVEGHRAAALALRADAERIAAL